MTKEDLIESVIGFEALYKSEKKCEKGVMRKGGVQAFSLNRLRNVIKLSDDLYSGKYKPKPTRDVWITYPKPRHAVANAFVDRVYQRSLNDNSVYPQVQKRLIKDNMACQKGKGTDAARKRFAEMLHSMYLKHGNNIWILQMDVQKYYDNMSHEYTEFLFQQYLDEWTNEKTAEVLHNQYADDKGYNPGSQMVQIAGISHLNAIDHFIKEQLRIKKYVRYMDDMEIVHNDYTELDAIKDLIDLKLNEIGLHLHPQKTHIVSAQTGILFLGFIFRLTNSGKVIMTCDPKKVKANRRKLRRMVAKAKRGEITREDCDNSLDCMIAHMSKGNSYKAIKRLRDYYKKLWEEQI